MKPNTRVAALVRRAFLHSAEAPLVAVDSQRSWIDMQSGQVEEISNVRETVRPNPNGSSVRACNMCSTLHTDAPGPDGAFICQHQQMFSKLSALQSSTFRLMCMKEAKVSQVLYVSKLWWMRFCQNKFILFL